MLLWQNSLLYTGSASPPNHSQHDWSSNTPSLVGSSLQYSSAIWRNSVQYAASVSSLTQSPTHPLAEAPILQIPKMAHVTTQCFLDVHCVWESSNMNVVDVEILQAIAP